MRLACASSLGEATNRAGLYRLQRPSSGRRPHRLHRLHGAHRPDLNRWRHAVDADGFPKVLRTYAEERLGLQKALARGADEPDFTVFAKRA